MILRLTSAAGIVFMIAVGWLFSSNRWRISWPLVVKGLLLQLAMALILLKTGWGRTVVSGANTAITSLLNASTAGTSMVFGSLANPGQPGGVIFFVSVTGTIVFVAAFTAGLFHMGILQRVVALFAVVMRRLLGTS